MKQRTYNTLAIIIAFILLLIIGSSPLLRATASARAESYTSVMSDLMTDKTFKTSDYPERANDYRLEVIQIAESSKGGLFVYVYQPSGQKANLRASSIRLARVKGDGWSDYELDYINSTGVFFKYSVNDFHVTTGATERYYDIVTIFRKFDKNLDTPPANGDTVSEVPFEVAQVWKATTTDGKVTYAMERTDVAVIGPNDMKIGFRRMPNGGAWWADFENCDAHFVAFNCDHKIDELYEADVTFNTQDYRTTITGTTKYDPVPHELTVKGTQKAHNKPYGAFGQSYEWQRIQTMDEFLKNGNFSDDDVAELKNYSWVLNFYETEFEGFNGLTTAGAALLSPALAWASIPLLFGTNVKGTIVSDGSVMRLNFQTDGKVYNLGVVSAKQTGSQTPIIEDSGRTFWTWLAELLHVPEWAAKLIFSAVVAIVALIVLGVLCKLLPTFGRVLNVILAVIFFPVTLLYYLIKAIQRRRERREQAPTMGASKPEKTKPKQGGKK